MTVVSAAQETKEHRQSCGDAQQGLGRLRRCVCGCCLGFAAKIRTRPEGVAGNLPSSMDLGNPVIVLILQKPVAVGRYTHNHVVYFVLYQLALGRSLNASLEKV